MLFLGEKEDGVSDDKEITDEHAMEHDEENKITSATKDVSLHKLKWYKIGPITIL